MNQNGLLTKDLFLRDVENHQIYILKDDDLFRHIRFSKPNSSDMCFSLTTWPGYLAYNGDMGDFVFTRAEDMFLFFMNTQTEINPGYWAEKVVSESIFGRGIRKFDVDVFRDDLERWTKNHLGIEEDEALPEFAIEEISAGLEATNKEDCISFVNNFYHEDERLEDLLIDFLLDHSFTRFTYHYIWACYAILWGIKQYNKTKDTKTS